MNIRQSGYITEEGINMQKHLRTLKTLLLALCLIVFHTRLFAQGIEKVHMMLPEAANKNCLEGDCENGTGKAEYEINSAFTISPGKAIYSGEFKNGRPFGKGMAVLAWNGVTHENCIGVITYKNGAVFTGEIRDFNVGQGVYKTKQYTATFTSNRPKSLIDFDYRFGQEGTVEYLNGDKYTGKLLLPRYYFSMGFGAERKNLELVEGTYKYRDGRVYTGEFDKKTGQPKHPDKITFDENKLY